MKNKSNNPEYKKRYAKIKKLMDNPEKFKSKMKAGLGENDFELVYDIARDSRIERLISELNIDQNKYDETKKRIIKLSPDSIEFPLFSTLFRDHDGKYKVEDLINEYHDNILRDGIIIGMNYGKKFIAEDIQNKRFSKDDIMNMSKKEIDEYCDEKRQDI